MHADDIALLAAAADRIGKLADLNARTHEQVKHESFQLLQEVVDAIAPALPAISGPVLLRGQDVGAGVMLVAIDAEPSRVVWVNPDGMIVGAYVGVSRMSTAEIMAATCGRYGALGGVLHRLVGAMRSFDGGLGQSTGQLENEIATIQAVKLLLKRAIRKPVSIGKNTP